MSLLAGCGSPAPPSDRAVEVAPDVDITLDTVPDLGQAPARGIKVINLGFVTAQGHACRPPLTDTEVVHRRNLAVRILQAAAQGRGRPVRVAYTLPADPGGLTGPAEALVRDARRSGVQLDAVNAMTMNMGTQEDPRTASITAAEGVERFLRGPDGGSSGDAAWGKIAHRRSWLVRGRSPARRPCSRSRNW